VSSRAPLLAALRSCTSAREVVPAGPAPAVGLPVDPGGSGDAELPAERS
jgi:hypothetical protein